jgi:cystathionine beta-lyase
VYGGEGGYILWMDFRKMFESEEELEEFLYKKAFFHVGMGSEYGEERFVRMCVASPRWCIEKALGTLKKALEDFFVKADTFS